MNIASSWAEIFSEGDVSLKRLGPLLFSRPNAEILDSVENGGWGAALAALEEVGNSTASTARQHFVERGPRFPGLRAGLFTLVLLTACGGDPAEDQTAAALEPVTATVAAVERTVTGGTVEVTGTVEANRQVRPGSKLLGRVAAVPVREGERVQAGQLLARLESGDLEAAVRQARAAVARGEAEVENAAAQKARFEELATRGSVTPRALEDVTTRWRVAAAALEEARAALQGAEVQLGYATLTSPLDGWVVERRVEVGDMVAPGVSLFTLEELDRVKVVAEIPESLVARGIATPGSAAEVVVLGESHPAPVARLLPAGDPASRTFEAHLFLENPAGRLRSGMFARVRLTALEPGEGEGVLRLPESAVVRRGQLEGVFVVDAEGLARRRWLRLGDLRQGTVEVLAGLEAGERYLVEPPAGLADGTPVREATP
jgi:RND family efflux transporter MFP subunit